MRERDGHAAQGLKIHRDLPLEQGPQLIYRIIKVERVFPFGLSADLAQQQQTAGEKDNADENAHRVRALDLLRAR